MPAPVGYLKRLRDICDRHGILLILDEVITGFGRLGAWFAADHFDVLPDIMTTAKAQPTNAWNRPAAIYGLAVKHRYRRSTSTLGLG